jgi:hypothetical protein
MKINKKELTKLIRESIKDKISKLRETSDESEKAKARATISILNDQAQSLDALGKHAQELFIEKQYSELQKEANSLFLMRDQKIEKIKRLATQFGIEAEYPKLFKVSK